MPSTRKSKSLTIGDSHGWKPMRTAKFATLFFILSTFFASTAGIADSSSAAKGALLYAVGESSSVRGSISVYEIAAEHRLIKTIHTVPNVAMSEEWRRVP